MDLIVAGLSNPENRSEAVPQGGDRQDPPGTHAVKLGRRDRAQLVILAYEHGLVPRSDA
jgi:hypothetical protein